MERELTNVCLGRGQSDLDSPTPGGGRDSEVNIVGRLFLGPPREVVHYGGAVSAC